MKFDEIDSTTLDKESHDEDVDEVAIMSDSEEDEESLHSDNNSNMDNVESDEEREKFMDDERSIMDAIEEEVENSRPEDNNDQVTEKINGDTSKMMDGKTGSADSNIPSTTLQEEVPTIDLEESDPEEEEQVDEEVEESDQEDDQEEEKNHKPQTKDEVDYSSELKIKKETSDKGNDEEFLEKNHLKNNSSQINDKKEKDSKPVKEEEVKPTDPKAPIVIENSLRLVYDTLKILSKKFNFIVSARRTIYRREELTLLEVYDPMAEKSHDYFSSFHLIVFEREGNLVLKIFYQQRKLVNETRLSKNVDPTILNEILMEYLKEISPGTKKTCKGAFDETMENVGFIDYKSVLIEGNASNVVYRSRKCKTVIDKGIICDACKTLLETYLCKNGLKIKDKRKDSTANKSMLVTSSGEALLQEDNNMTEASIESLQHKLQGERMGMTFKDFLVEAILESDDKRAKLSDIYERIYRKYPHLERRKQFENSLRHNLSILKGKVFKQVGEVENVGKGGYWSLMPGYVHQPQPRPVHKQRVSLLKPVMTEARQAPLPNSLINTVSLNQVSPDPRARVRVRMDQAEEIDRNIRARLDAERSTPGGVNVMNIRQHQIPPQQFIVQPRRSSNLPPSYAKEGLNSQIFSSPSNFVSKTTPSSFSRPNAQYVALPSQAVVNQSAWKSNPPKYLLVPKNEQGTKSTGGMSFLTQQSPNSTLNASSKVVLNHRQGSAKTIQLQNPTRKVFVDDGKLILQNNMTFPSKNPTSNVGQVKPSDSLSNFGTTVMIKTVPRTLK